MENIKKYIEVKSEKCPKNLQRQQVLFFKQQFTVLISLLLRIVSSFPVFFHNFVDSEFSHQEKVISLLSSII